MLKNYYFYNYSRISYLNSHSDLIFFTAFAKDLEFFLSLASYSYPQKNFKIHEFSKFKKLKKSKIWLFNKNFSKLIDFIEEYCCISVPKNFITFTNLFTVFFYILNSYNSLSFSYKLLNLNMNLNFNSRYIYTYFKKTYICRVGINFNDIDYNYGSHQSSRIYFYFFFYLYNVFYGHILGRSEKKFFFKINFEEFYMFFLMLQKQYTFIYNFDYQNKIEFDEDEDLFLTY